MKIAIVLLFCLPLAAQTKVLNGPTPQATLDLRSPDPLSSTTLLFSTNEDKAVLLRTTVGGGMIVSLGRELLCEVHADGRITGDTARALRLIADRLKHLNEPGRILAGGSK